MYVAIMKIAMTVYLGCFGIIPVWCDCCGEMYYKEQMKHCVYIDHNEELNEGDLCPVCFDYWF